MNAVFDLYFGNLYLRRALDLHAYVTYRRRRIIYSYYTHETESLRDEALKSPVTMPNLNVFALYTRYYFDFMFGFAIILYYYCIHRCGYFSPVIPVVRVFKFGT